MPRLWTCHKCGERCAIKNKEAHARSDYCKLQQVRQKYAAQRYSSVPKYWLKILHEAGVPIINDIVSLEFVPKRKYDLKAVKGIWVPTWADIILTRTRGKSHILRVLLLHYLVEHPEVEKIFLTAYDLGGWKETYKWLYELVKGTKPRVIPT